MKEVKWPIKRYRKDIQNVILPESAWAKLSKEEREETDRKKRAGSRKGKQFVKNTKTAAKAGKAARAAKCIKVSVRDSNGEHLIQKLD